MSAVRDNDFDGREKVKFCAAGSMKRRMGFVLLLAALILGGSLIWQSRTTTTNAIVLQALACTCPDYRVVQGAWKLRSPLLDTIPHVDIREVYVSGIRNPWNDDPFTMYDYMIAEGEIIGVDRVSEGDPWNPVIEVVRWDRISEFDYPFRLWGAGLLFLIGAWLLWKSRDRTSAH